MSAYLIITRPKRQVFLALVMLHHKVVRLSTPFIVKVLAPDEITTPVQDHWARLGYTPAFWRKEVETAIITLLIPL